MTTPLTFSEHHDKGGSSGLHRRNLLKGAAGLAATAVTMKAASAATRDAIRPDWRPNQFNRSPAPGAAIRQPLSGFSPGAWQEATQTYVRAERFPGFRRYHGG